MADALATLQQRWAGHLRDPSQPAPAGIEPRRLAVYRRLCIDSLDGLLTGSLPRLQGCLGPQAWRRTVERYYAVHACHTPLFPQIAAEFAAWLSATSLPLPAWAAELAHFECQQSALRIAADLPPPAPAATVHGQTLLARSPLARVLGYRWPVHDDKSLSAIAPPSPTLLLLHRDPRYSLTVQLLSPAAYALLQAFDSPQPITVFEALAVLASCHAQPHAAVDALCTPLIPALLAAGALRVPVTDVPPVADET